MDYIISFPAGASGRFVNLLLTVSLYDIQQDVTFNEYNFAHDTIINHPSDKVWKVNENVNNLQDSLVFTSLQFTSDLPNRMFWTHAFPLLTVIDDRKTIIISYEQDDELEIITNAVYKNLAPPNAIPSEQYKYIMDVYGYYHRKMQKFQHDRIVIPTTLQNNFLVLPYKKLLTPNGLDCLLDFANATKTSNTVNIHRKYLNNRLRFISTYAPWLT